MTTPNPASTNPAQRSQWTPLAMLHKQFDANLAALRTRDADLAARIAAAAPAESYYLAAEDNRVILAKQAGTQLVAVPNPVPPIAAQQVMEKLFPSGACTEPVNVAGLDQGWIWDALYRMECKSALPMHRPPLYFLAHDLTKLWTTLHFQDWTALLADTRVKIFAGTRAVYDYRKNFVDNARQPLPRLSLTVEPALWQQNPTDSNLTSADAVYQSVLRAWESQLTTLSHKLAALYPPGVSAAEIDRKIASGEKLRVLGITSRYTTFLQYSMRDWLAAFDALGHETRLHIEQHDAETTSNVVYLGTIADFRPDVAVIIDHYRAEYRGLPASLPVAMWVQDRLPNIFNASAGAAQGERDFCLGFGRLHLSQNYGYPKRRFLTAPVGVNENRFAGVAHSPADLAKFACDASFVSHHSTPAETLLQKYLEPIADENAKRLLNDVFEKLRAHYEGGGHVLVDATLRRIIRESAASMGLTVTPDQMPPVQEFFGQSIVNALFRQTALKWVAESGVNLHLYGRGWENHPYFKRFARGVADNDTQLATIYAASKINLQITPFGAVHQRLLDGLAAGSFFLLRHSPGDEVGSHYRALWTAIEANAITTDDHLHRAAAKDKTLATLVTNVLTLEGPDFATCGFKLFDVAAAHADSGFMVAAGSIWPTEYDAVAFRSQADCTGKLKTYLARPAERQRVATAMRQAAVERASYTAITRKLLTMMGEQLTKTSSAPTRDTAKEAA